jgi:LAGLIDADG-like domain
MKMTKQQGEWKIRSVSLNKLTERELGYVIGMVNGDGYFYYEPHHRHYTVEFYLNSERDQDVQEFLICLLTKCNLKINIRKDNRYKCNRLRIRSKIFYNFVKTSSQIKANKDFMIGFISGMIDSDGEVILRNKTTRISNTNKKLIRKLIKYFKNLEIKVTVQKIAYKDKNWMDLYRILVPERFIKADNNSIKVKRMHFIQRSGNL